MKEIKLVTHDGVSIPLKSGLHVIHVYIDLEESCPVSIPLKSGLHVILARAKRIVALGFNPLKIGSTCNYRSSWLYGQLWRFNPLKIGSTCNTLNWMMSEKNYCFNPLKIGSTCNIMKEIKLVTHDGVSIPLKSGLHVIQRWVWKGLFNCSFNPLKIGSTCNIISSVAKTSEESFNPLKIGSTCNEKGDAIVASLVVSIPLKSGLHVITKKTSRK